MECYLSFSNDSITYKIDGYEAYSLIPSCRSTIENLRSFIKNLRRDITFLDVGSGVGDLINALSDVCSSVTGVEYRTDYFNRAKTKYPELDFVNSNVFWLGPDFYSKFDFIYLYRPIKDNLVYEMLIDRIVFCAKSGTIIAQSCGAYIPEGKKSCFDDHFIYFEV